MADASAVLTLETERDCPIQLIEVLVNVTLHSYSIHQLILAVVLIPNRSSPIIIVTDAVVSATVLVGWHLEAEIVNACPLLPLIQQLENAYVL